MYLAGFTHVPCLRTHNKATNEADSILSTRGVCNEDYIESSSLCATTCGYLRLPSCPAGRLTLRVDWLSRYWQRTIQRAPVSDLSGRYPECEPFESSFHSAAPQPHHGSSGQNQPTGETRSPTPQASANTGGADGCPCVQCFPSVR